MLSHRLSVCLVLQETGRDSSKMVVPFYTPTSNVSELYRVALYPRLTLGTSVVITVDMKWYIIVVLI